MKLAGMNWMLFLRKRTNSKKALQEGRIAGAALDVFAKEPDVPEALLTMENVVLQPHQGSASTATRRAMDDLVVENVRLHFAGKPVRTPV